MAGAPARQRLTKPLLFGTVFCALATAFAFRHRFFSDIKELRAQENQYYEERRQEVLQRRERQLAEIARKRSAS